jgi:hypothetical protein
VRLVKLLTRTASGGDEGLGMAQFACHKTNTSTRRTQVKLIPILPRCLCLIDNVETVKPPKVNSSFSRLELFDFADLADLETL